MRRNQIPMSQGHSNGLGEHGIESDSRFQTLKLRCHTHAKQGAGIRDAGSGEGGEGQDQSGRRGEPSSGVISANERNPKIRPTDIE